MTQPQCVTQFMGKTGYLRTFLNTKQIRGINECAIGKVKIVSGHFNQAKTPARFATGSFQNRKKYISLAKFLTKIGFNKVRVRFPIQGISCITWRMQHNNLRVKFKS